MDYDQTKEILKEDMTLRNYALETQKKFIHSLKSLSQHANKLDDSTLLNLADVKNFLEYLKDDCKLGASTVNNYHTALKFLYEVTLKKPWDEHIFPYLKVIKSYSQDFQLPGIYSHKNITDIMTLDEALHRMVIEMELRGFATGSQSTYLRLIKKCFLQVLFAKSCK
jgi:site-specific recombinase XerD